MTFTVKSKSGTLPAEVRDKAGFKVGDVLEFKVSGGVVTVVPKLPTADDEYTPRQRAIIDAQLAEGLADIATGRVSRTFETHQEFVSDLHTVAKKYKAQKTKRTSR